MNKPIAVYGLTNTASLQILEVTEDYVSVHPAVVGNPNFGGVETCPLKDLYRFEDENLFVFLATEDDVENGYISGFMWGESFIPFSMCMPVE